MPQHKLQGRMDFQGLPISVENKKGSVRHWHDPFTGKDGETKMLYPYGYVKGSLGSDKDAVDVYVGPDKESEKVFIVLQMKAPDFKETDENKCMLGFSTAKEAKAAYLHHYNNPKFFGSMKEVSITEFKHLLSAKRGKLIKHLIIAKNTASIEERQNTLNGRVLNEDPIALSVDITEKDMDESLKKSYEAIEVLKAMTAITSAFVHQHNQRSKVSQDSVFEARAALGVYSPQIVEYSAPRPKMRAPIFTVEILKAQPERATCVEHEYTFAKSLGCPICKHTQGISEVK